MSAALFSWDDSDTFQTGFTLPSQEVSGFMRNVLYDDNGFQSKKER